MGGIGKRLNDREMGRRYMYTDGLAASVCGCSRDVGGLWTPAPCLKCTVSRASRPMGDAQSVASSR